MKKYIYTVWAKLYGTDMIGVYGTKKAAQEFADWYFGEYGVYCWVERYEIQKEGDRHLKVKNYDV